MGATPEPDVQPDQQSYASNRAADLPQGGAWGAPSPSAYPGGPAYPPPSQGYPPQYPSGPNPSSYAPGPGPYQSYPVQPGTQAYDQGYPGQPGAQAYDLGYQQAYNPMGAPQGKQGMGPMGTGGPVYDDPQRPPVVGYPAAAPPVRRFPIGWVLFGIGFIFPFFWLVGAFLPACQRPRYANRSERLASLFNVLGVIAVIIILIVVIPRERRSGYGYYYG